MRKYKLGTQIFFTSFAISLLSLIIVTWYASDTGRNLYLQKTAEGLHDDAILIREMLLSENLLNSRDTLQQKISQTGKNISLRITLILPDGHVIADSEHDPATMDNHGTRPEVVEALARYSGQSVRYSKTVDREMMYVALFIKKYGEDGLIIRTSKTLSMIEQTIDTLEMTPNTESLVKVSFRSQKV